MTRSRNELGERLRAIREEAGISGRQLASEIGAAHSYVSKMESGHLYPSEEYVRKVSRALKLSGTATDTLLALLQLQLTEPHPALSGETEYSERQRAIGKIESSARHFRNCVTSVVDGLLQTGSYAQAIFGMSGTVSGEEIGRAVQSRLARQRVLADSKRRFSFIITESAVRTRIAPPEVMRDQCEHIIELSAKPNIDVWFVPWSTPVPSLVLTNYAILDETMVLVSMVNGYFTLRSLQDVTAHLAHHDLMKTAAITGNPMVRSLRRIAADHARVAGKGRPKK